MAVEVLSDGDQATMFCNTSMRSFGPVHSEEVIRAYRRWLIEHHGDPRTIYSPRTDENPEDLWRAFIGQRDREIL